eukprot:GHVT01031562.1.p1 GENE.GHVT01031562.1~~GHVT01031562.1.p1  ORF type:complete len:128 (-),score=22.52 GHVT01031562.1:310-693(-)
MAPESSKKYSRPARRWRVSVQVGAPPAVGASGERQRPAGVFRGRRCKGAERQGERIGLAEALGFPAMPTPRPRRHHADANGQPPMPKKREGPEANKYSRQRNAATGRNPDPPITRSLVKSNAVSGCL